MGNLPFPLKSITPETLPSYSPTVIHVPGDYPTMDMALAAALPFYKIIIASVLLAAPTLPPLPGINIEGEALGYVNGERVGDFTVVAASNIFTLVDHGLDDDERVALTTTKTLPGTLTTFRDYFVIVLDADTFKLSLTEGGGEFDVTAATGSGTHTIHRAKTQIVGGTRFYGNWNIGDAGSHQKIDGVTIRNIGFDNGPQTADDFFAGVPQDGLAITNQNEGGYDGWTIENVIALSVNGAVSAHGFSLEKLSNGRFLNLSSYNGAHCGAFKTQDCLYAGYKAYGGAQNGGIIKNGGPLCRRNTFLNFNIQKSLCGLRVEPFDDGMEDINIVGGIISDCPSGIVVNMAGDTDPLGINFDDVLIVTSTTGVTVSNEVGATATAKNVKFCGITVRNSDEGFVPGPDASLIDSDAINCVKGAIVHGGDHNWRNVLFDTCTYAVELNSGVNLFPENGIRMKGISDANKWLGAGTRVIPPVILHRTGFATVGGSSTAQNSLLQSAGTYEWGSTTVPNSLLLQPLTFKGRGRITRNGTPNLTIRLNAGGAEMLALTFAVAVDASFEFEFEFTSRARTAGSGCLISGKVVVNGVVASIGTDFKVVDCSGPVTFDITEQWDASHGSNTVGLYTGGIRTAGADVQEF